MAHELCTVNGRTAMMYVGEVPWHGLGTRLGAPATAREAIQAAGLDYDVALADLTTTGGVPVVSRKAVVRTDTDDVLGVVGDRYQPIQNAECFSFLAAPAAEGEVFTATDTGMRAIGILAAEVLDGDHVGHPCS